MSVARSFQHDDTQSEFFASVRDQQQQQQQQQQQHQQKPKQQQKKQQQHSRDERKEKGEQKPEKEKRRCGQADSSTRNSRHATLDVGGVGRPNQRRQSVGRRGFPFSSFLPPSFTAYFLVFFVVFRRYQKCRGGEEK